MWYSNETAISIVHGSACLCNKKKLYISTVQVSKIENAKGKFIEQPKETTYDSEGGNATQGLIRNGSVLRTHLLLFAVDPLTTSTHKHTACVTGLPVGALAEVCMLPYDRVNSTNEPPSHQFNCLAHLRQRLWTIWVSQIKTN